MSTAHDTASFPGFVPCFGCHMLICEVTLPHGSAIQMTCNLLTSTHISESMADDLLPIRSRQGMHLNLQEHTLGAA